MPSAGLELVEHLWEGYALSLPELVEGIEAPWDVVARAPDLIAAAARRDVQGDVHPSAIIEGDCLIERGASVGPCAYICGPTIIRSGASVRHSAYIRGHCLLEPGALVGHDTEVKNAVFLSDAKAPHFAYVGDSVLGAHCNLGAGTKLANVRVVPGNVVVRIGDERYDTGLRKLGALVGNRCKVGCNVVLNPGTVLEMDCVVYSCVSVRGHHVRGSIVKGGSEPR
ncbi:MAG TPA: glucose-1-phosphate thymidylyltransferase [Armatimonadota bacterium]|nr:glucose-1-phosphate thymidylyltransferase [Armatimonadota bacterium]